MARGANQKVNFAATTAIDLIRVKHKSTADDGSVTYIVADEDGTLELLFIEPDGTEQTIKTVNTTAGTMNIEKIAFPVPELVVRWTPDAQPGTVFAESVVFGA